MSAARRVVGVIGGSGVTGIFEGGASRTHRVATPWGAPSGPIEEGEVGGLRVLFLPRHGPGHTIPPHRVNYRANVDALRFLGAEAIVTVSSVGSLKEELPPGTFVLPAQFLDFTKQRPTTFYDGGRVYHVSLADPFCPDLSRAAAQAGRAVGTPFAEGKTYVCVEGPRFSTRAESAFFRTMADVIGMTLVPEVTLARERALCYVSLADPFCPDLLARAVDVGRAQGVEFATGRTYVCVEGPRFSTRAESRFFRGIADVIGMTLVPEVTLARERAVCYLCVAMVTDFDVWADRPVEVNEILEQMHRNVTKMHGILADLLPRISRSPTACHCAEALDVAGV